MKNAVPKNDKKRRKQLTEDVAKLEREMEQKHRGELEQLKLTFKDSKLRALSHILKTPIEILQADAPPIIVGEEYPRNPLVLVYMRHAYGLGEHYNSVTRLVNSTTENCS